MKRKIPFAVGFVLIGVVSLVSYMALGNMNSADKPQVMSTPENRTITVRVETDKASYAIGEAVLIKAFFTNRGPTSISFLGVDAGYMVLDSNGEVINGVGADYLLTKPYTLNTQNETLFFDTYAWGQMAYDFRDPANVTGTARQAELGTYTIRFIAYLSTQTERLEFAGETKVTIKGT